MYIILIASYRMGLPPCFLSSKLWTSIRIIHTVFYYFNFLFRKIQESPNQLFYPNLISLDYMSHFSNPASSFEPAILSTARPPSLPPSPCFLFSSKVVVDTAVIKTVIICKSFKSELFWTDFLSVLPGTHCSVCPALLICPCWWFVAL